MPGWGQWPVEAQEARGGHRRLAIQADQVLAAERRRRCSSTVERVRRGLGQAPSVKLRGASDGDEDPKRRRLARAGGSRPFRGVAGVAAQGCRVRLIGYHARAKHETRFTHLQEGMLARVKNLTEAMTKTQLFSDIAEKTKLTRRQVADVFEALESVIERHVQKGAVGACTIPGLMKIKVVKKPAQRARKNVPNPFGPVRRWTCRPSRPAPP